MSYHADGRLTKSELQEWYTKLYFDRSDDVAETIRAAVMRVLARKKIQADGKNIVAKALARGYCSFPDAQGNKTELPEKKTQSNYGQRRQYHRNRGSGTHDARRN